MFSLTGLPIPLALAHICECAIRTLKFVDNTFCFINFRLSFGLPKISPRLCVGLYAVLTPTLDNVRFICFNIWNASKASGRFAVIVWWCVSWTALGSLLAICAVQETYHHTMTAKRPEALLACHISKEYRSK